jgi:FAD/FMN-containing dehydrogenase
MENLSELEIDEFRKSIQGTLISPTNEAYDASRAVWNGMIDKHPGLICQCKTQSDVVNAVNFAQNHNILISVKGGGHNVAGNAVCEGGLMIDLSQMKGIKINHENQTVEAEAGLLWNELDAETQKYGLATTGGTVSHTGVAGLTLGGGLGWLMGKHGLSCDNLLSAEIVLANGETLTANENQNTDIFWAIRGGGGNFGIVTSFTFQLHKVGPNIIGGMILYPRETAPEVLKFYREFARTTPDELMIFASLMYTPDGIPVIALLVGWFGELSEGELYIKPIRDFGSPMVDLVAEMPYVALNSLIDAAVPHGLGRYWKSGYLPEIKDELIDTIMEQAAIQPSPYSFILFFHVKGKAARIDSESTAYGNRGDLWDFDIVSQWADPADATKNTEWVRNFFAKVEPLTKGVYVNHLDVDDGNARVKAAYGKNYERLLAVKKQYDPTNFFRLNNNIVP